jgi:hypothetical protein
VLNASWKLRAAGTAAGLLVALSGCNWDKLEPEPLTGIAAEVGAIRMTLGTQVMTLYNDGKLTLGPLSFARPSALLTMELLDRDGDVLQASGEDLQINVSSESANVISNFVRRDSFSGTLTATNATGAPLNPGSTRLTITLFDRKQRRPVFGPYLVPIYTR